MEPSDQHVWICIVNNVFSPPVYSTFSSTLDFRVPLFFEGKPARPTSNVQNAVRQLADLEAFERSLSVCVPSDRRLDGFVAWFECDFAGAATLPHWRVLTENLRDRAARGGRSGEMVMVTVCFTWPTSWGWGEMQAHLGVSELG